MQDHIVCFEKVVRSYGHDSAVVALNEIDLVIERGSRVAIMGQSGSGKSTLLNIACGLDEPSSGRVIFDGHDMAAMNDDDRTRLRRQKIGMIFQTFNLLATLSAIENVSLPLRLNGMRYKDAAIKASEMLDKVGLHDRRDHRPDEMSGGERQRVAIARAIVFDPPLLLADEPTGNLDSSTGDEILSLLDTLHDGLHTTLILVTHNDEAARHCERQIRLRDGRVIEDYIQDVHTG